MQYLGHHHYRQLHDLQIGPGGRWIETRRLLLQVEDRRNLGSLEWVSRDICWTLGLNYLQNRKPSSHAQEALVHNEALRSDSKRIYSPRKLPEAPFLSETSTTVVEQRRLAA